MDLQPFRSMVTPLQKRGRSISMAQGVGRVVALQQKNDHVLLPNNGLGH